MMNTRKKIIFIFGLLIFFILKSTAEEANEDIKKKSGEVVVPLMESNEKNNPEEGQIYDGYRDEGRLQVQKNIKKTEEAGLNNSSGEVD